MEEIKEQPFESNKERNPVNHNRDFWIHFSLEIATLTAIVANIVIQVSQQYRFRFYESQLETYVELVSVTGQIASINVESPKFEELKTEFYSLYFGKSQLFRGKNDIVAKSIVEFNESLKEYSGNPISSSLKSELKKSALQLANACNEELND